MTLERDPRFTQALEDCSRRVRDGETLERCLADYPEAYRDELARLVPVTDRLQRIARDPSAEFEARLGQRLAGAVAQERTRHSNGFFTGLQGLLGASPWRTATAALLVALIIGGSSVSVTQAAETSLPDSPLYPVKVAREWIEVRLANTDDGRIAVASKHLEKRDQELERALQAGRPALIESIVRKLIEDCEQMVGRALVARRLGNTNAVERASAALDKAMGVIQRLQATAPADAQPALRRASNFLQMQQQRLRNDQGRRDLSPSATPGTLTRP